MLWLGQVGKVTSYEGKTKMVTLIPLALYPIYAQAEDLEMDAQQDEDLYLPPYNHDGTLEVCWFFFTGVFLCFLLLVVCTLVFTVSLIKDQVSSLL